MNFNKVAKGTNSVNMAVQSHSDRLGRVSSTSCRAEFDSEYISGVLDDVQGSPIASDPVLAAGSGKFSTDHQPKKLATDTVRAINKCLRSYREITEEYWLRDLFVEELLHFVVWGVDSSDRVYRSSRTMTPSPMTGFGSTISNDEDQKFRKKISSDQDTNIFLELEFNVRNEIDIGQHDIAAINSYRIFELWVKNATEEIMIAMGKSQNEIDDKLKDSNGEYASLMNIIKNILKDDPDVEYDFSAKTEFETWDSTTNEYRNEIIHEGTSISRTKAKIAHENTGAALKAFYSDFSSELSGTKCDIVGYLGDLSYIPDKSP